MGDDVAQDLLHLRVPAVAVCLLLGGAGAQHVPVDVDEQLLTQGIVNRYDLQAEFPILTLRRTYWKTALDELLWIWQKKSNNIHDLHAHIWDQWADETGSIGKAYGYQLRVKHHYPEGDMDQVDRALYDLKHNPASRRILTNIYTLRTSRRCTCTPAPTP